MARSFGRVLDFLNAAGERFGGGLARDVVRAPKLLTFLKPFTPDSVDQRIQGIANASERAAQGTYGEDTGITQQNAAARAGATSGSVLKGASDIATLIAPTSAAEGAVKGLSAVQKLEEAGQAGSLAAKVGGKVLPFLAGSLAGSTAQSAQDVGQGKDVNLAKNVAIGAGIDVATAGAGRLLGKGFEAVKSALGKDAIEQLAKTADEGEAKKIIEQAIPGLDDQTATQAAKAAAVENKPETVTSSVADALKNTTDEATSTAYPKPDLKPGERQRGLYKTTSTSDELTSGARQAAADIAPQGYTPIKQKDTLDAARQTVETNYDQAKKIANEGLDAGRWDANTSAHTIALIEKASKDGADEELQQVLKKAGPLATASGQANQLWSALATTTTPDKMVRFAEKTVEDANKNRGLLTKVVQAVKGEGEYTLDDATRKLITDKVSAMQKLPDGAEKQQLTREAVQAIADRVPPGASELFDSYRYSNMLSNPRTSAKNTIGNLFNAMVTRPSTLATRASTDWAAATLFGKEREFYLKEVPHYYRGLFGSIGDAAEAAKGTFLGDIGNVEADKAGLSALRGQKMPGVLKAIPNFLEAQDKFFSTLISSGEYASQLSKGIGEDVARKEAGKVAEYSLYRAATDPTNATGQGALLSKIDQFTETVEKAAQKHSSLRWFVPFIKTPMNVSKQMIEFSPAGFATLKGSASKTEQFSKAMTGSMLTVIGAKLALDGNTTWDVPKDPTQRQLFYQSGKRPYSIKIGDKWVPMISFGPLSLALALPAAAKNTNDDQPLDANALARIGGAAANATKFFSQQTYVQGIANFVSLLTGEGDATLANSLGFTAGQVLPAQGLQRYVAGIIDPTFRKAGGFAGSIQRDIPFASRGLEPYTDMSGAESKRNISDYISPYTIGNEQGSSQSKEVIAANASFLQTIHKTSKPRSQANAQITKALEEKDYSRAQQIAQSYNDKLKESFKPWAKKYGQYDNADLTSQYRSAKINLTRSSISQRLYNQRRQALRTRRLAGEQV